jgi:hypothetical protein
LRWRDIRPTFTAAPQSQSKWNLSGGAMTEEEEDDDKSPPGTKRAIVGLALWVLGGLCVVAVSFYLMYLLFMAVHHHHHRHF